jgi:hypothetical protein
MACGLCTGTEAIRDFVRLIAAAEGDLLDRYR